MLATALTRPLDCSACCKCLLSSSFSTCSFCRSAACTWSWRLERASCFSSCCLVSSSVPMLFSIVCSLLSYSWHRASNCCTRSFSACTFCRSSACALSSSSSCFDFFSACSCLCCFTCTSCSWACDWDPCPRGVFAVSSSDSLARSWSCSRCTCACMSSKSCALACSILLRRWLEACSPTSFWFRMSSTASVCIECTACTYKSRRGAFMESLRESSNRGCGATRVVVIPQLFHHTLMHALPSVTDMLLNILFATNDSMQTYDNKIYHER
mmetsp:Transcript_37972/g.72802  ORF Transcript_37972/g.72802 Transcript_37972/m.72802 type:complete len:269 (-) Transcript_37972:208-1014(-)